MFKRSVVRFCVITAFALGAACAQTDAGITASVKSKLAADDTVKAHQIDVDTKNHVVTLKGTVDTAAAKERALVIARDTKGVTSVIDVIVIAAPPAATSGAVDDRAAVPTGDAGAAADRAVAKARDAGNATADQAKKTATAAKDKTTAAAEKTGDVITDASITTAVKTKLLADTKTPGLKIDVDTKNGIVTLSGDVANAAERANAVKIARGTKGVKRVVNKLTIAKK